MTKVTTVLFNLAIFAIVKSDSSNCKFEEKSVKYVCNCDPDEDLYFFSEKDEPDAVEIRNCASVNVPYFAGSSVDLITTDYVFENITNTLSFDLSIHVQNLAVFKLLNIGEVPFLKEHSFEQVSRVDNFHIENTKIGSFGNIFHMIGVKNITLKNVTIEDFKVFDINSMIGEYLNIVDCRIKVRDSINTIFEKFKHIWIRETVFESSTPGNFKLVGDKITLNRISFINTSLEVIGREKIDIRGTCASGNKSQITLKSENITSLGNKGSNEIIYEPKRNIELPGNKVYKDSDFNCNWTQGRDLPNHAEIIDCSLLLLYALVSYFLLVEI